MNHLERASTYICPMHGSVKQSGPGQCPQCGMALVPAGTRFALLRHIFGNPRHLMAMAVLMILIMAAVMMFVPRRGY